MTSASEQASHQLLSRPPLASAGDSSWVASSARDNRRLVRLHDYVDAGRLVWWRRGEIYRGPFRGVAPKWHVFVKRTRSENPDSRWTFTWRALCARQNARVEILDGPCDFKVTTPPPNTRCQRCVSELEAIRTAPARSARTTIKTTIDTDTDPAAARRRRLI